MKPTKTLNSEPEVPVRTFSHTPRQHRQVIAKQALLVDMHKVLKMSKSRFADPSEECLCQTFFSISNISRHFQENVTLDKHIGKQAQAHALCFKCLYFTIYCMYNKQTNKNGNQHATKTHLKLLQSRFAERFKDKKGEVGEKHIHFPLLPPHFVSQNGKDVGP